MRCVKAVLFAPEWPKQGSRTESRDAGDEPRQVQTTLGRNRSVSISGIGATARPGTGSGAVMSLDGLTFSPVQRAEALPADGLEDRHEKQGGEGGAGGV